MKLPKEELEKRREEKNHKVVLDEILAEENLAKSRLPPSYFAGDLWLVLLGGLEVSYHNSFHSY